MLLAMQKPLFLPHVQAGKKTKTGISNLEEEQMFMNLKTEMNEWFQQIVLASIKTLFTVQKRTTKI